MGHLASLNAEFSAQWARTLEGGKVGWLVIWLVGISISCTQGLKGIHSCLLASGTQVSEEILFLCRSLTALQHCQPVQTLLRQLHLD